MVNIENVNPYVTEHYKRYKSATKDKKVCTLVALHCVTGWDLFDCDDHMIKYGRAFRKGMFDSQIERAMSGLRGKGFKVVKGSYSRKDNRIAINQFIKKHPEGSYYVIHRGHAFAIIDGVVYDHSLKLRRQIFTAYKVIKEGM